MRTMVTTLRANTVLSPPPPPQTERVGSQGEQALGRTGRAVSRTEQAPAALPVPLLPAAFEEVRATNPTDGAFTALALTGSVGGLTVHVADALSEREAGRLHARGLALAADPHARPAYGPAVSVSPGFVSAGALLRVRARDAREVLWTMERALGCSAVSLVVGEVYGAPAALDFTASRRLALAAERHETRCVLVRLGGGAREHNTAARRCWRIASLSSAPAPHDDRAPGAPHWRVDLLRARGEAPASWVADRAMLGALLSGVRPSREDQGGSNKDQANSASGNFASGNLAFENFASGVAETRAEPGSLLSPEAVLVALHDVRKRQRSDPARSGFPHSNFPHSSFPRSNFPPAAPVPARAHA